jgi:hypothetical protein
MKKLYTAKLNNADVWMVREENNTIGYMFQSGLDSVEFISGKNIHSFGIAVNNEVMTMGVSVGFLKDVKAA